MKRTGAGSVFDFTKKFGGKPCMLIAVVSDSDDYWTLVRDLWYTHGIDSWREDAGGMIGIYILEEDKDKDFNDALLKLHVKQFRSGIL